MVQLPLLRPGPPWRPVRGLQLEVGEPALAWPFDPHAGPGSASCRWPGREEGFVSAVLFFKEDKV